MNKFRYLLLIVISLFSTESLSKNIPINERPVSVNLNEHNQVQLTNGFKITFIEDPSLPLVKFALAFKNQSVEPGLYLQTNKQMKYQAKKLSNELQVQAPPFSGKVVIYGGASSQEDLNFQSLASLLKPDPSHHYKVSLGQVSQQFLSTVFTAPVEVDEYSAEEFENHYKKAFSAANAHLFVSGSFSEERLIEQIYQAFGNLPMEASRERDLWQFSKQSNINFVDSQAAAKIKMALVFNDKGEKDLFVRLTNALIEQLLQESELHNVVSSRFYESKSANFTLIDVSGDLATIHIEFKELLELLAKLKDIDEQRFLKAKQRLVGAHLMALGTLKGKLTTFVNAWFENESELVWKKDLDKLQSIDVAQYKEVLNQLNAGQVNILAIGNKAVLEAELKQNARLKDFW